MSAMAIIVASSDTEAEDSPMTSYRCPAPAAIRQWGKQYMMDAMREHGFPARIAYSTAVGHCAEWMGLKGAPLLRAVWQAMEPAEGPEFCASFEKIFGNPFWPLVHHLEGEDEVCHLKREDEFCNTDFDTPGANTDFDTPGATSSDAIPTFRALFVEEADVAQSASQNSDAPVMSVQEQLTVPTADAGLEQAEESPLTTDASVDST